MWFTVIAVNFSQQGTGTHPTLVWGITLRIPYSASGTLNICWYHCYIFVPNSQPYNTQLNQNNCLTWVKWIIFHDVYVSGRCEPGLGGEEGSPATLSTVRPRLGWVLFQLGLLERRPDVVRTGRRNVLQWKVKTVTVKFQRIDFTFGKQIRVEFLIVGPLISWPAPNHFELFGFWTRSVSLHSNLPFQFCRYRI